MCPWASRVTFSGPSRGKGAENPASREGHRQDGERGSPVGAPLHLGSVPGTATGKERLQPNGTQEEVLPGEGGVLRLEGPVMVEATDGGEHRGGRSRYPGWTEGGGLLPPRAWLPDSVPGGSQVLACFQAPCPSVWSRQPWAAGPGQLGLPQPLSAPCDGERRGQPSWHGCSCQA